MNYLSRSESLTAGTHRSAGPACQRKKNRATARDDAVRPEFTDGNPLRRQHWRYKHPHDLAHTLGYLLGPIAATNSDGGEQGSTMERLDGKTPELTMKA